MSLESLSEIKQEIRLLVEYGAPEELRDEVMGLVDYYESDIIALRALHHFYSYLPEAKEDAIVSLRLLARRQGSFLLCAATKHDNYLYLATTEQAEFVGTLADGLWNQEILNFFGIANRDEFCKKYNDPRKLPAHEPTPLDDRLCPACMVEHGELHAPGCPVEICPWCEGQLTACQCRFVKLEKEQLSGENHIKALMEKLEEKGRIPFNADQHRPSYPDAEELVKG